MFGGYDGNYKNDVDFEFDLVQLDRTNVKRNKT